MKKNVVELSTKEVMEVSGGNFVSMLIGGTISGIIYIGMIAISGWLAKNDAGMLVNAIKR